MTWVMYLWLASQPGCFTPIAWFDPRRYENPQAECNRQKGIDIDRNRLAKGKGGGATYVCMYDDGQPPLPCKGDKT